MNDIFKLFKKRTQSGKTTVISDVIKDLNETEQNELVGGNGGSSSRFDRGNKSYVSISKSGRVKSRKTQQAVRSLKEDMFSPTSKQQTAATQQTQLKTRVYDPNSDNADSSSNSSFK